MLVMRTMHSHRTEAAVQTSALMSHLSALGPTQFFPDLKDCSQCSESPGKSLGVRKTRLVFCPKEI